MAIDGSFSFLNRRKRHTNLKLKLLFKIDTQTTLTEQNRSSKTSHDRPIQIAKHLTATAQFRSQIPAIQANHRYTNSAKLHTKIISKITQLLEYRIKNDSPIYTTAKAIEYPRTILDTSQKYTSLQ